MRKQSSPRDETCISKTIAASFAATARLPARFAFAKLSLTHKRAFHILAIMQYHLIIKDFYFALGKLYGSK